MFSYKPGKYYQHCIQHVQLISGIYRKEYLILVTEKYGEGTHYLNNGKWKISWENHFGTEDKVLD